VPITVTADGGAALFVTLTTLAQGRFSDNAFLLPPGDAAAVTIDFLPFGPLDADALATTLRVEHFGLYM
jgi:beta-mannosidase